jgi:cell wall-associated NlpC family hydrolase
MYAISLADTGYLYGGNSPDKGFDCSGLVQYVFKESAHIRLPRTSLEMSRIGQQVEADDLRPGDLVFFNTLQQDFSHVGIYVGEDKFVHAPKTGKQIRLANMQEKYWNKRYNGARRIGF